MDNSFLSISSKSLSEENEVSSETTAPERAYTIAYANIMLEPGLWEASSTLEALQGSWRAGASITRYSRNWQISRRAELENGRLAGRIGFVNDREVSTLAFDQKQQDFVRGEASSGTIVPFMIDTSTGIIAFQLIPGVVRPSTFTGALQALLNSGSVEYQWSINILTEELEFSTWLDRVSRVTSFSFRLERPNPHYFGNDIAEQLLEEVEAIYVTLSGSEVPGEGINQDSDIFRQAMDHVLRNYGNAALHASDKAGTDSVWVKAKGFASSVLARKRVLARGDEEIPERELEAAILSMPLKLRPAASGELEDESA